MSNYPPGVTGFEPQIAGYDERPATREVGECINLGEMVVVDHRAWGHPGKKQRRVSARVCLFEGGEVEGVIVEDFFWECPSCGHENVEAVDPSEFEPDPDYARDLAMEW